LSDLALEQNIAPWRYPPRSIALRLFFTAWIVYTLHFATNIVREIYPALSIGDHFSFRVDEYANMHPDLFEKKGYGWHIGNNPGASMLAAVPYAVARPIIDFVVERIRRKRLAAGLTEPPSYNTPWPMARDFYKEAWRRGLDIKFGLAVFVMQLLCMAPSSALAVVIIFFLLRILFRSDKSALWLSLLYAFGTPVFFRTGFLNHNMMLGHIAFMGFVAMWNPGDSPRWPSTTRFFLGGLAGGTALLFDYSGGILLLGLFVYGLIKRLQLHPFPDVVRHGFWYVMGTLAPVFLLWYYQWQSFGNPFLPGQHWMPPVEWIELGYQGYGWPQLKLLIMLAFDFRFGFFLSSPIMLLALLIPFYNRRGRRVLPDTEVSFLLLLFVGFWVFFSGSNYTQLQFNTGIRYMVPMLPFMFVLASAVLVRLPRWAIYCVGVMSFTESWCLAMVRDVESGPGLLNPILQVFLGGFKLPWLTTLSHMSLFHQFFETGASPLPFFCLAAAIIYGLWTIKIRRLDA
jgi:hypothetical protein